MLSLKVRGLQVSAVRRRLCDLGRLTPMCTGCPRAGGCGRGRAAIFGVVSGYLLEASHAPRMSLADELGSPSAACRQIGIARTLYYE